MQIGCNFRKKAKLQQKVQDQNTIKTAHSCLVKTIWQAAEKPILKISPEKKKRPPVAYWNEECEREERLVRAEYREHHRDPTNTTKLWLFKRRRAIKQRVFMKARKNTRNKFVNSLNSRIPNKKV